MNDSLNAVKAQERARRSAMRQWGFYLLALTAWVTVVIVAAFAGFLICSSVTWYGGPLYSLLTWIRDYIVFVVLFVVLSGWVVISWFFIARPVRNLSLLLNAAGALAHPGDDPISLPPSMSEAQDQLNLVREQALRDARAAREAEQRKNDLVVYLAHDLKTPLTSVIGYLTLLRDEPELPAEFRARYTGIALDKAERLEDLINEFFEITRFNLTHIELEKQTIDLTLMLEQEVSEFGPIFAESGLTCRLCMPKKLMCSCDPEKLSRVFDNLLRNASYYSTPGTEVLISGCRSAGETVLMFKNSGRTIPQEKLDRLFEQFFRLDSSRGTRTGGAGLGLAIAKEIVELHGGTISAASSDGTVTFTVTLPSP